jgi:hypothetical protein
MSCLRASTLTSSSVVQDSMPPTLGKGLLGNLSSNNLNSRNRERGEIKMEQPPTPTAHISTSADIDGSDFPNDVSTAHEAAKPTPPPIPPRKSKPAPSEEPALEGKEAEENIEESTSDGFLSTFYR